MTKHEMTPLALGKRAGAYLSGNKPFAVTLALLIVVATWLGVRIYQDVEGEMRDQLNLYEDATVVEFEDPAFEREVRELLQKETGNLYDADLETISKMVIQNEAIESVDELVYFTGLRYLEISSARISDVSAIGTLDRLQTLILSGNQIKDISPLAGCISLQKLDLSNNLIMDASPLYGLDKLIDLNLSNNSISHVTEEIRNLTNLKLLNFTRNRISDMSVFSNMPGLNTLYLSSNKISQVVPLENMDSLVEYSLEGNSLSTIETLGDMPALEKLSVGSNCLTDLSFAPQYPWLLELTISNNDITSLEPLRGNTDLQALRMQATLVTDVTPLAGLEDFHTIYMDEEIDREQIRFMKKESGWQFRNGDTLTKTYVLDDIYGFSDGASSREGNG